jgi:NTE family protein
MFQSDQEAALALAHPTDLKALSKQDFDRIARHGFEVADATLAAYASDLFTTCFSWPP